MKFIAKHRAPILMIVCSFSFLHGAGAVEKKLKMEEVPAPVRAALQEQAKGGTIIDVDVNEESGKQVYTSEIHIGPKEIDVRVAPDGKVLSVEPGNGPSPAPPPTALETAARYRFWIIGIIAALLLGALWLRSRREEKAV